MDGADSEPNPVERMSTLVSAERTLRDALVQGPKQPQVLIAAIYQEHGDGMKQTVRSMPALYSSCHALTCR